MTTDGHIRVEWVASCLLCGKQGKELYAGLRDRLFGAPGVWGFMRCPECGLVWLNPRPLPEDLHQVYATYFTHDAEERPSRLTSWREKTELAVCAAAPGYEALAKGWGWKLLGRALSLLPPFREVGRLGTMCLNGGRKGKLLDVGCGNGRFLSLMRDAGWEVTGVESDPAAAKLARERFGIRVITGTLPEARLGDESFDAVTLSHVIEHVYDPVGLLSDCHRVLKPAGRLVVVTPNVQSLAHHLFRDSWRDLDPPRHLCVFALDTLTTCSQRAGLQIDVMRTSARMARGIFTVSRVIQRKGVFSYSDVTLLAKLRGLVFRAREEMALRASAPVGEELLMIGSRTA